MDQQDIIILGGGISGLSLAYYCAQAGLQVTLLEKDQRVGGAFHSHRTTGDEADFWLELGAHTCYNSYGSLIDIITETGLASSLISREKVPFKVFADGKIKSIVSQINFLELLGSIPGFFYKKKPGESVESYYSAILGKQNYSKLFQHFFNAVPSQDTREFPADALFKSRPRRKDVLKSFTVTGGLQTITDMLASQEKVEICTGVTTQSIEFENSTYAVTTHDGRQYESRYLACATPSFASARLLQAVHPEIAGNLSRILSARINTQAVIVQQKSLSIPPLAGIVSPNDLFYSAVSRDTVADDEYRGFTFHFKPEVTDRDVRLERICQVLGLNRGDIESTVEKENSLPALRLNHQELIGKIDQLLPGTQLLLTGNYFAGVAIEDCVSRSLTEFKRLTAK
jgi:oxygen-dependent protoporphyrinogen oxidase